MDKSNGQFKKGEHRSRATEFKKGQHWRPRKPFWEKAWLENEYVGKQRAAIDIAAQFGVGETAILFWLKKHNIPTRGMSEVRKVKHWGQSGTANPMYGKRGEKHPNWAGGVTPFRQSLYASYEWGQFALFVFRRDQGNCQVCGGKGKDIHHIIPLRRAPMLIMDPANVILLCKKCHKKMQGKERRWENRLFGILTVRGVLCAKHCL
jgi:hypothetical protein